MPSLDCLRFTLKIDVFKGSFSVLEFSNYFLLLFLKKTFLKLTLLTESRDPMNLSSVLMLPSDPNRIPHSIKLISGAVTEVEDCQVNVSTSYVFI